MPTTAEGQPLAEGQQLMVSCWPWPGPCGITVLQQRQKNTLVPGDNSKLGLQSLWDHMTGTCSDSAPAAPAPPPRAPQVWRLPLARATCHSRESNLSRFLFLTSTSKFCQRAETRNDWDQLASKLELEPPKQVQVELALQAWASRRQPLPLPCSSDCQYCQLSRKYCPGKLSDTNLKGLSWLEPVVALRPRLPCQCWVTSKVCQASWVK